MPQCCAIWKGGRPAMARGWANANNDPTAGVKLMPRMVTCPRCGVAKGRPGYVRPGLCGDCREVVPRADRAAWAA